MRYRCIHFGRLYFHLTKDLYDGFNVGSHLNSNFISKMVCSGKLPCERVLTQKYAQSLNLVEVLCWVKQYPGDESG